MPVPEANNPVETKERYGRFVLLAEDARTSAGSFYRAVLLGPSGYERHVDLFRTELLVPEIAQAIAEGLKAGLAVQHAQIARGVEAGRIDKTAYVAVEMFEGRSVGALMERSKTEGHSFAADHALLIASKAAAAIEAAQAKKHIHGFLVPEFIHVSHDGEVAVRAFGLAPRLLRQANSVGVREARFLAPEVDATTTLDIRADVFSLGAQLFEMLTGSPLPRTGPLTGAIEAARIPSPGTDGSPLPKALASLLGQALAEDPGRRFKDAAVFKKAVDTLLFSGDYSPTTFNLAFFMHTLFRDEGDVDAAKIKAEKTADYRPYMTVAPAAQAPVSASGLTQSTAPVRTAEIPRLETPKLEVAAPRGDSSRTLRVGPPSAAAPSAPPAAQSDEPIFETVGSEKKKLPVAAIAFGAIALIGVAGYLLTRSGSPPPAPAAAPTMNAAESAALVRVRELEARLAALEAEKAAAEQKATEEATQKVEAQARARGRAVDPAELQRAQEEARRKAQAEQAALVAAERQKIDDERRIAEEARTADAAVEAERPSPATPTPAPSAAAPPAPSPTSTASAVSPVPSPGAPSAGASPLAQVASAPPSPPSALLDVSDPNVTPPVLVSQSRIEYPPVARAQRITGSIVISALVDELGNVAEARVIRGAAPNSGLNQAALENVKRRKYKPATMGGKPGRAWIAVQIEFKL